MSATEPAFHLDGRVLVTRLTKRIRSYGRSCAVVAFSGGVDSSVVLATAARALGTQAVTAVTAVSASYPMGELEQARDLAATVGVGFRTVETGEVETERYARNDALRCYQCKTELYSTLRRVAAGARSDAVVLAGANLDDTDDFRPGLRAADEQGVRNPLLDEGLGKAAVRAVARRLGLVVADKPALACLSSRVAFGLRITPELLTRIDHAEGTVRELGFDPVRVRHLGEEAVIEVAPAAVGRLLSHPRFADLLRGIADLGWRAVRVDPEGYRSGRMNATLLNLSRKRRTGATA